MKKEIRITDKEKGVVRITTSDERWYCKPASDDTTGLPVFKPFPSVTWIVSVYPKLGLQKLRDELGAEETDLLKKLGGERGSKVHDAITAIIQGEEVRVDSEFTNPNTGQLEPLSAEEVRHVMSFVQWRDAVNPKFLIWDVTVISERNGYGGTIDAVAEIDGEIYFIDFKTSKVIGTDYEMQISAYAEAVRNGENEFDSIDRARPFKLAILQLGTKPLKTNPQEFRWREVENRFDLFMATRKIWEDVYHTQIADERGFSQRDFPLVISPAITVDEAMNKEVTPLFEAMGMEAGPELPKLQRKAAKAK